MAYEFVGKYNRKAMELNLHINQAITLIGQAELAMTGQFIVGAAVAQGVGFIGSGIMIRRGDHVENITTATGIGVALGFKLYLIAALTVAMMFCARFLPGARRSE